MKIQALHLAHYIRYAQVRGIGITGLPEPAELPPDFGDETAMINDEAFYRVLRYIHTEIRDDLWGIKAGNFLALKLLGLVYHISLQTTTIGEALHYLQSYLAATLPLIQAQTNVSESWVTVTLKIENEDKAINRIILENTLTIISREIRMMSAEPVIINLGTPFYNDTYLDGWQKNASFAICFAPGVLKAALRKRTQLHIDILVPQYLGMIEQLKPGNSFANKVKITMLSLSDPELPGMQSLCDVLCVTPRTLQRRLGAENITYRALSEDLKKQICAHLLRHVHYTVSSISHILGYSEPAAFIHSFKKWFGHPPERVRQQLKNNQ